MLKVFNNRVLRKMFGPKRDKVAGKWKRLHSEKLYHLYSLLLNKYYKGVKLKKREMDGACGTYGGQESCIQGFGGET